MGTISSIDFPMKVILTMETGFAFFEGGWKDRAGITVTGATAALALPVALRHRVPPTVGGHAGARALSAVLSSSGGALSAAPRAGGWSTLSCTDPPLSPC